MKTFMVNTLSYRDLEYGNICYIQINKNENIPEHSPITIPENYIQVKIVDIWVTDLPLEVKIGVELLGENYHKITLHSCRGRGTKGKCLYLNPNEIFLRKTNENRHKARSNSGLGLQKG